MPLNLPNRIIIPDLTVFEENPIPILRKTLLTLLATSYSHFSPTQYALGASWRITDRVLVAADATYYQWSEMQNPTPFTELELVGGLGDLFPVVQAPPPPDPDFRDVIVPAVGVEITAFTSKYFELLTRAGYSYRPTPVPDQVKETNFVDSDTHLMSGGLGFQFKEFMELVPRPFTLDFYFQYFLLEDRRIIKEDLADAVGDYEASGGVFHGGGTITLRF